jgi:enamine deaminase RidA (YjgF/YER057c/UK114 family)
MSTEIKRYRIGPRMSRSSVHNGTVYLAGQVAKDLVPTVAGQAKQILAQIDELLAESGTDKSKLLMATIVLKDMRHYDEFNTIWDPWISPDSPPSRAIFDCNLVYPGALVLVIAVAAL